MTKMEKKQRLGWDNFKKIIEEEVGDKKFASAIARNMIFNLSKESEFTSKVKESLELAKTFGSSDDEKEGE